MSFSYEVKNFLCDVKVSGCCRLAECYGFLLFNRAFSYRDITLLTEHEGSALFCARLIKTVFGFTVSVEENKALNGMYKVSVDNEINRKKLMIGFGYTEKNSFKSINREIVSRDCCAAAFIRGAFLASGSISDPEKGYHAEFSVSDYMLADEFYRFLKTRGLKPKKSLREKNNVIYFKDSSSIEDLLTLIGAGEYSLKLMEIKILKDVRNKINRINNCDNANISKTVNAAVEQKNAILKLKAEGKLSALPEVLQEAAELRINNPEMSLAALSEIAGVSRSGLNHRLKRLVEIASVTEN